MSEHAVQYSGIARAKDWSPRSGVALACRTVLASGAYNDVCLGRHFPCTAFFWRKTHFVFMVLMCVL